MGFETLALGVNAGPTSGLKIDRTVIASQSTPTNIKLGQGNLYGVFALVSGTAAAYIQYFDHGGVTLGVSTPTFEVGIPAATTTIGQTAATKEVFVPIGIPFQGTATTSGIWIAAGAAASTGAAVAASTVTVYTLYS